MWVSPQAQQSKIIGPIWAHLDKTNGQITALLLRNANDFSLLLCVIPFWKNSIFFGESLPQKRKEIVEFLLTRSLMEAKMALGCLSRFLFQCRALTGVVLFMEVVALKNLKYSRSGRKRFYKSVSYRIRRRLPSH